jgi:hypothetical protein
VTDAEWLQTGSVGESTILEAKEHRNYCALPRNEPSRFPHFSYGANEGGEFEEKGIRCARDELVETLQEQFGRFWIAIQGLNNLTVAVEGPTVEVKT